MSTQIQPSQWLLIVKNSDGARLRVVAEMMAMDFANYAQGGSPLWTAKDLPRI